MTCRYRATTRLVSVVLLVAALAIALSACRTAPAAVVNGDPVSQEELNERLRQRASKQILDELINEKLVFQEATKKRIAVPPKDVDKRIDQVKKQFPNQAAFNKNLKENNMTLDQVKAQIRLQMTLQRLLKDQTRISSDEIKAFYEQNKEIQFKGKSLGAAKKQIEEQLLQQKTYENAQAYIEQLKSKAKIENNLD